MLGSRSRGGPGPPRTPRPRRGWPRRARGSAGAGRRGGPAPGPRSGGGPPPSAGRQVEGRFERGSRRTRPGPPDEPSVRNRPSRASGPTRRRRASAPASWAGPRPRPAGPHGTPTASRWTSPSRPRPASSTSSCSRRASRPRRASSAVLPARDRPRPLEVAPGMRWRPARLRRAGPDRRVRRQQALEHGTRLGLPDGGVRERRGVSGTLGRERLLAAGQPCRREVGGRDPAFVHGDRRLGPGPASLHLAACILRLGHHAGQAVAAGT